MNSLLRRLRSALWEKALWRAAKELTVASNEFVTFHRRPKYAAEIGTWSDPGAALERCAIVMQGPPHREDNFTVESLSLYKRLYPSAVLYLSTWTDADSVLLEELGAMGVTVIRCEKPSMPGLFNLNMQLVTSHAGVAAAHAAGAEWILKTRTDQRMYSPNALQYLIELARTFPPADADKQRHRIIGVGRGTLKYAPYHLSDQTVFGHSDDMLAYWNAPLRNEAAPPEWPTKLADIFSEVSVLDLCRRGAAEPYLTSSYLERIGRPLQWTLEDSWAAFRDHFCIADYETTDLYWHKAQAASLQEFDYHYRFINNRREFGFRDWLLLYKGSLRPSQAELHNSAMGSRFVAEVQRPADSAVR